MSAGHSSESVHMYVCPGCGKVFLEGAEKNRAGVEPKSPDGGQESGCVATQSAEYTERFGTTPVVLTPNCCCG